MRLFGECLKCFGLFLKDVFDFKMEIFGKKYFFA